MPVELKVDNNLKSLQSTKESKNLFFAGNVTSTPCKWICKSPLPLSMLLLSPKIPWLIEWRPKQHCRGWRWGGGGNLSEIPSLLCNIHLPFISPCSPAGITTILSPFWILPASNLPVRFIPVPMPKKTHTRWTWVAFCTLLPVIKLLSRTQSLFIWL